MKNALFSKMAGSFLLSAGLLASGAASAQSITITFNADGNTSFTADHAWSADINVDTYLFDVAKASWAAGSAVVGRTTIDGARLANYAITGIQFFREADNGSRTNLATAFTTAGGIEFYPVAALTEGAYGFTVTGHTLAEQTAGGLYTGTMNLVPVPEPTIYTMLAVGISLLAFTARRTTNDKLGC